MSRVFGNYIIGLPNRVLAQFSLETDKFLGTHALVYVIKVRVAVTEAARKNLKFLAMN